MKHILGLLAVGFWCVTGAAAPVSAATCSASIFNQTVPFTCPDPIAGPQGPAGADGADGAPGAQGVAGVDGADGKDGVDGKDGKDGRSFDATEFHEGLATIGALNVPYVERNFAASLNAGFYESETAIGVGAAYRFDNTWQFGGSIAVPTSGGDVAGKAALTGQW